MRMPPCTSYMPPQGFVFVWYASYLRREFLGVPIQDSPPLRLTV